MRPGSRRDYECFLPALSYCCAQLISLSRSLSLTRLELHIHSAAATLDSECSLLLGSGDSGGAGRVALCFISPSNEGDTKELPRLAGQGTLQDLGCGSIDSVRADRGIRRWCIIAEFSICRG